MARQTTTTKGRVVEGLRLVNDFARGAELEELRTRWEKGWQQDDKQKQKQKQDQSTDSEVRVARGC